MTSTANAIANYNFNNLLNNNLINNNITNNNATELDTSICHLFLITNTSQWYFVNRNESEIPVQYALCKDTIFVPISVGIIYFILILIIISSFLLLLFKYSSKFIKARNPIYLICTLISCFVFHSFQAFRFLIGRRIFPCGLYTLLLFVTSPFLMLPPLFRCFRTWLLYEINLLKTKALKEKRKTMIIDLELNSSVIHLMNSSNNNNNDNNTIISFGGSFIMNDDAINAVPITSTTTLTSNTATVTANITTAMIVNNNNNNQQVNNNDSNNNNNVNTEISNVNNNSNDDVDQKQQQITNTTTNTTNTDKNTLPTIVESISNNNEINNNANTDNNGNKENNKNENNADNNNTDIINNFDLNNFYNQHSNTDLNNTSIILQNKINDNNNNYNNSMISRDSCEENAFEMPKINIGEILDQQSTSDRTNSATTPKPLLNSFLIKNNNNFETNITTNSTTPTNNTTLSTTVTTDDTVSEYMTLNEREITKLKIFKFLSSHKFIVTIYILGILFHFILWLIFGGIEELIFTSKNDPNAFRIFIYDGGMFEFNRGCSMTTNFIILIGVQGAIYVILQLIIAFILAFRTDNDTLFIKKEAFITVSLDLVCLICFVISGQIDIIVRLTDYMLPMGTAFSIFTIVEAMSVFIPLCYSIRFDWKEKEENGVVAISNLERLLHNKKTFNIFLDFARRSFCPESVLCWNDLQKFKRIRKSKRRGFARYILEMYLNVGNSPLELNIPLNLSRYNEIRLILDDESKELPKNLFDYLELHCIKDMFDIYIRLVTEDTEINELVTKWEDEGLTNFK
ncbi:hypothetical protein ABK040_000962 [Willaertia magna]